MSNINLTCDVCGREVLGCTFVNGMKFCAKCYQETFGETDKDRKIADLEAKLAESEEKCKKAYQEGLLQKQFDKDMEIEQLKQQLRNLPKKIVEDFYDEIRHRAILEDDYCPDHNLERKYGVRKCLLEDIRATILKKYGGTKNEESL